MKADVQYNDFIGTSAADINDFQNLYQFLESKGIDTKRYKPIGVNFYTGDTEDFVLLNIICIDNNGDREKAVKIQVEDVTIQDVVLLFKRLDVVLSQRDYVDYELVDNPVLTI